MVRAALIACGLLTATAAQAQDWRMVALSHNPEIVIAIDANIERTDPARPVAWILLVYPAGVKRYAAINAKVGFDCTNDLMRGLENKAFDENGGVVSQTGPQEGWSKPPSNSAFDMAYGVVCGNVPMGEPLGTGSALPIAKAREVLARKP